MKSDNPALDLIEELRLRQWARQNYVPLAERSDDWHPVVLDEMRLKDSEIIETPNLGATIVPLCESRHLRIDAAHTLEKSPRYSPQQSSARSEFHYS